MSCTVSVSAGSSTLGGSTPVDNVTFSWVDAGGSESLGPVSGSPPTPLPLNGVNHATVTASAPGFQSVTMTVYCDGQGAINGNYEFIMTPVGSSGGGGGSSGSGCFIVTAAYGTETAPEVELLQGFRDNVLLRTRWGSQLFQELWKYYYRVSPAIAGEMSRDPELRRVLSFAIVEPWVNYMKLMMARPDFKGMNLDGLDPELRAFLQQFQGYGDKWIKGVELPKSFQGRDPEESVDELNMVLSMVLLRTDGRVYLDDLERRGELPLQYPKETEAKLRSALTEAGRTEDEVASILHGTVRH